jgi:hypothetical protein
MSKYLCAQQAIRSRNLAIQNLLHNQTNQVEHPYLAKHVLNEDSLNVAMFLDMDYIRATISSLHSAFSSNPSVLHTFAAKACQLKVRTSANRSADAFMHPYSQSQSSNHDHSQY